MRFSPGRPSWALAVIQLLLVACSDGPIDVGDPELDALVVSDTSRSASASVAGATSVALAEVSDVAYTSAPPGSFTSIAFVQIVNRRTGAEAQADIVDGGFDPLGVAARPGDTLETHLVRAGARIAGTVLNIVPARRRPVVVRTIPTRKKKDVPLNARITIIFSEPIDPGSLGNASIRVTRGSTAVPGTIMGPDSAGLSVDFIPETNLAAAKTYQLIVSEEIRDRDGDQLESEFVTEFTTEGTASATELIAYFGPGGIYVADDSARFPTRIHSIDLPDGSLHRGLGLSWSPGGDEIAFAAPRFRSPGLPGAGIFIAKTDGSGATQLTRPSGIADDIQPAWSPDGNRIAFVRFGGNGNELDPSLVLYTVKPDGTGLTTITSEGERPSWSPDGQRLAFSRRDGIYVINADGTSLQRLTSDGDEPAWSPDGTRILFVSQRNANLDIYVVNANGSGERRLTTTGFDERAAAWSPDGRRIVFGRESSGWYDIFMMDADGSSQVQLTNTPFVQEVWAVFSRTPGERSSLAIEPAPGSYTARQVDTVFATLPHAFEVRVLRNGQPAAGVTVSWTVSGGTIPNSQTTTDQLGRAFVVATLNGPAPQWLSAEASVAGAIGSPVAFQAAGTPGNPALLRFDRAWRYDPDRNQLSDDGRALVLPGDPPLPFSVESTDRHGNLVLGVRVDFAVLSGRGSVSPAVDTTAYWQDEEGYCGAWCMSAYTYFRLGPDVVPQSITATASELGGAPQLTFIAVPVSVIVTFGNEDPAAFTPGSATVTVGATVGWRLWWGNQEHNLTFEDDVAASSPSRYGHIHTRTFSSPGVYRYRCALHSSGFTSGEVGVVVVQ